MSHGLASRWAIALIRRYQRSGGGLRWFGVDCNFEPTCSEYARQALELYGFRRGVRLGWRRIRRCGQPDLPARAADPLPDREGPHAR